MGGIQGTAWTTWCAPFLRFAPPDRLRLSSIEPWDLTAEFFTLWQDPRLCRHLHLPLQSGCDATLRRMNRHYTTAQYAEWVAQARAAIPGLALTTDVIAGFPGETEDEHAASAAFVELWPLRACTCLPTRHVRARRRQQMPGQVDLEYKAAASGADPRDRPAQRDSPSGSSFLARRCLSCGRSAALAGAGRA